MHASRSSDPVDIDAIALGNRALTAVSAGDLSELEQLLRDGLDVNRRAGHEEGSSLLAVSVLMGHRECCRRLLAAGADISARNDDGWTVVTQAVMGPEGHACIDLLAAAGADLDASVEYANTSLTALHIALHFKRWKTAVRLLESGARDIPEPFVWLRDALQALQEGDDQQALPLLETMQHADPQALDVLLEHVFPRIAACGASDRLRYAALHEQVRDRVAVIDMTAGHVHTVSKPRHPARICL